MTNAPQQAHWETLLELYHALLTEKRLAQQRQLIIQATESLTEQKATLWLTEDPPPDPNSLIAQSLHQHTPYQRGLEQAQPLFHPSPPTTSTQPKILLGVLQAHLNQLPAATRQALIAQIEIGLAAHHPQSKRREQQLHTLAEVNHVIASELNLDKLLQKLADLLHYGLGYPFVHLFVVQAWQGLIEFRAGHGAYAQSLKREELRLNLDGSGIIAEVARNGRSVLVNNVHTNHNFIPLNLPGINISAELTVPAVYGDKTLGVLDVESEALNAFSEDDRWLLETLAGNVAVAIRNATLYRSERWRRQAADSLRQIAGVVRAKETLDNTLLAILNELARLIPLNYTGIWLKTERKGQICYQHKVGYGHLSQPPEQAIAHPWLDKIVSAPESSLNRTPDDPPLPQAAHFPADHDALGAVLSVDENVLGVLVLVHRESRRFGPESQRLVEIFANQAAIVLENTDLYHHAQSQAWVSTALLQVAEATRNLNNLSDILNTVTRLSGLIAGVKACLVFLPQANEGSFHLQASYGLSEKTQSQLKTLSLGENSLFVLQLDLINQKNQQTSTRLPALLTNAPAETHDKALIINQPAQDSTLPAPLQKTFAGQNLICLPLSNQGDLSGLMLFALEALPDHSLLSLGLLRGIAHQTAAAIQTAHLIEAQQSEAYLSTALLQVAQAVVAPAELAEVLESVVRITPLLLGVSHSLVFLRGPATEEPLSYQLSAAYGLSEVQTPLPILAAEFPALHQAISQQTAHQLNKGADLPPRLQPEICPASHQLTGLVIPLNVQQHSVGAFVVCQSGPLNKPLPKLSGRQIDLLIGIAYQIALAVDNARLNAEKDQKARLEQEMQLARNIQRSFVPQSLPILAEWSLASVWKMAREVGGDFFDVQSLPGEKLLILIADVADKGFPASLFMARTSSLFRAIALENHQPAEILRRVNQLLLPDAQNGMFVSVFCAVLDLPSSRLDYASAGHNPPIYLSADGALAELRAKGIVLGVIDDPQFEQKSLALAQGDRLIFYTDGVTEAFNAADEMFGEGRLRETLQANLDLPPESLVDRIYQAVSKFTYPHPQSDDFTLLLLQKTPPVLNNNTPNSV